MIEETIKEIIISCMLIVGGACLLGVIAAVMMI